MEDFVALLAGGGVVALILRWLKTTGWLTLIPDRTFAPNVTLRGLVTLGIAVGLALVSAFVQGAEGEKQYGVAVMGALSTHSAVFGVTPLGQWIDATVPKFIKRPNTS